MIGYDLQQHIRRAIYKNTVAVDLKKGDVLVFDNFFAAHGRMGMKLDATRKVLTALVDPIVPVSK